MTMRAPRVSWLKKLQYKLIIKFQPRKNLVYTQFDRFRHQAMVMHEKVIPFLRHGRGADTPAMLDIVLFGSSDGAEPFSIASSLLNSPVGTNFRIRAFDIVPGMVGKSRRAIYSPEDVQRNRSISDEFVKRTFDFDDVEYKVKQQIRDRVTFEVGNVLDRELFASLGQVDMVFAQNFLFHLKPALARDAVANLVTLLKPRSALFIDGMDTGMRIDLTTKYNLEPVDYLVEEVHNDAFVDRGENWSNRYWGREPFSADHPQWLRKYCTVFLQDRSATASQKTS